jgi:mRNA interferase MazF
MARLSQLLRSGTRSSSEPYCPDVGDIITVNFDPQAGREQAGRRPALVLSARKYNQITRLCVACAMTNQGKGYPFEVAVPNTVPKGGGFVLADHIKSLDWSARSAQFECAAPSDVVAEVMAKLRTLLP